MSRQSKVIFEFDRFRLDPDERLLWRDNRIVPLTPKVFDTLLLLVQNKGHLITKEEMIEILWRDSFVEEGSLTQNISLLRKTLGEGDRKEGPQFIETLPKRGYRFVADVRELVEEAPEEFDFLIRRRTRTRIIAGEIEEADAGPESVLMGTKIGPASLKPDSSQINSVAVLPFKLYGMEESESYLGLGLADALITQLSNTGQIVVRPTSAIRKYAEVEQDSVSIGCELKVDAALEGQIQRAGERLRVTVQMVSVSSGAPLWADRFNAKMTDIFEVQDAIAEQVASALTLKLSGKAQKRLEKRYTQSIEAYHEYLKGRYFWNKRDPESFHKAVRHFQQAIEHDPTYALAYAGLADAYNILPVYAGLPAKDYFPLGKAAAIKALEIDENLAEAHASLGLALVKQWNWQEAEVAYRRAVELNPNYAAAHWWYGMYLYNFGRFDESIAEIRFALELDPLSLAIGTALSIAFHFARQYDMAVEQHKKTLEIDPDFIAANYHLGITYEQQGKYDEAIVMFQRVQELSDNAPYSVAAPAVPYALSGRADKAREILNKLFEMKASGVGVSLYDIATIYANLGEKDEAFAWLEKCFDERHGSLSGLKVDPEFDSLRSEPRFDEMLCRIGLAS
jgi:TolB-like protein/DNA-binding winged helix-turn-helix (wHTH) protein